MIEKFDIEVLDNRETFLRDDDIKGIKNMFSDKEKYEKYMKTLWILRDLVGNNIDIGRGSKAASHPQFPIWELTNNLIGALLREDIDIITNNHNIVFHYHDKEITGNK